MALRRIRVIGVPSGCGPGIPDCRDGLEVLPALHFLDDLAGAELAAALALADGDECLLALEIVEYNPDRDACFATARASHDLCCSLIGI